MEIIIEKIQINLWNALSHLMVSNGSILPINLSIKILIIYSEHAEIITHGSMQGWGSGAGVGVGMLMGLWFYGFMVFGFLVLWFYGFVFYGFILLLC